MNKFEKHRSVVRNTYSIFHSSQFKKIGRKSYFLHPMFLSGTKNISMGVDVGIWDNARVELLYEWNGQHFFPELIIGSHVNIGQNLHLVCTNRIVIEDNVVMSGNVTILDNAHITDDNTLSILQQGIITKPVHIKEGAFIGINVVIMPGVTIGKHAIVGASAVVTKDIPDYATAVGIPARIIKEK